MTITADSDRADVARWIQSEDWYQRIELPGGLETPGKIDSKRRLALLCPDELKGKSVIDVGCNSGFYCFWAKKLGAERVVGVDLDPKRLAQGRTLAAVQQLDIDFQQRTLASAVELGQFDIVFCFAVLTEIPDLAGSLTALAQLTRRKAYVELAVARPMLYLSRSRFWLKSLFMRKYSSSIVELKPSRSGWTLSPSLGAIRRIVGEEFEVTFLGKGLRYDMICIERK